MSRPHRRHAGRERSSSSATPEAIYRKPDKPVRRSVHGDDQCADRHRRDRARAVLRGFALDLPKWKSPITVCVRARAVECVFAPRPCISSATGRPAPAGMAKLQATVVNVEFIGALSRLDVRLASGATTQSCRARRSERRSWPR